MENIRAVLSGTLLASAATGAGIVLTDQYLWSAAPSHAYGLIGFIAIDAALAFLLLSRKSLLGTVLSIGLGTTQLIAMLADVVAYSTQDVAQQAFRAYLLGNPLFVALLVMQPVILGLAFGATNLRTEYVLIRGWFRTNLPV